MFYSHKIRFYSFKISVLKWGVIKLCCELDGEGAITHTTKPTCVQERAIKRPSIRVALKVHLKQDQRALNLWKCPQKQWEQELSPFIRLLTHKLTRKVHIYCVCTYARVSHMYPFKLVILSYIVSHIQRPRAGDVGQCRALAWYAQGSEFHLVYCQKQKSQKQSHTIWCRYRCGKLILYSWSSCLYLPSTRITSLYRNA